MRILLCICILCAGLAAKEAAKTAPRSTAAKTPAAKTMPPPGIPRDAVQTAPGLYRWTDKTNTVWMYRSTPFSVTKWRADSEDTKLDAVARNTTARDLGDSIRFERASPFGKRVWVRKKTDLDETEQAIWARQQKVDAASGATKGAAGETH